MSAADERATNDDHAMSSDSGDSTGPTGPRRRAPKPLPVLVLADVSGSMEGEKIAVLNQSISSMFTAFAKLDSIRGEIHVAVVTFGDEEARLHVPPVSASKANWADMVASGRTPMGAAFDLACRLLEDDELVPDRAFTPTLVLVSDGFPTDDWETPLHDLLSSRRGAKAMRLAIKIGTDGTDDSEKMLETFSTPGVPVFRADEVHKIAGFFRWVTATVTGHLQTGRAAPRLEDLDHL